MRKISSIIIFIISMTFCISCTLEMSDNGKLDGFWHINTIDSINNKNQFDVSEERLYWSIQKKLINVRSMDNQYKECIMHFERKKDTLLIKDPHYYNHDENDMPISDVNDLRPYGINSLCDSFIIENLNSSKMILRSKTIKIYFKKL